MKYLPLFLLLIFSSVSGQNLISKNESYPTFQSCKNSPKAEQETCFKNELKSFILSNYNEPSIVASENYEGVATVIFEVDKDGVFQVLYVNSDYKEINQELESVFNNIPKINPATYNGKQTYVQFRMTLKIPLS